MPQIRSALQVNVLFIIGVMLVPVLSWSLKNTRWGMILRTVGDSSDAAKALGYHVNKVRTLGTMSGGFLAGDDLDVTLDEDRCQLRKGRTHHLMALFRNLTLSLLRLQSCRPIASSLRTLAAQPYLAIDLVSFPIGE